MPPTTTVTISRGTTADEYGDEVNILNQLYTGVPAIIAYQSDVSLDPASGNPVEVGNYQAFFDNGRNHG